MHARLVETADDGAIFLDLHKRLQIHIRNASRLLLNGQKQIDIAEFAHRQEDVRDTTATASFYLDDLVKWGNYGFVTEKVFATKAQLDAYFKGDSSIFSGQEGLSGNDWNGSRPPRRPIHNK